jgi:biotin synthase-like enzyme
MSSSTDDFKHGALSPEMCAYCFFSINIKAKIGNEQ